MYSFPKYGHILHTNTNQYLSHVRHHVIEESFWLYMIHDNWDYVAIQTYTILQV